MFVENSLTLLTTDQESIVLVSENFSLFGDWKRNHPIPIIRNSDITINVDQYILLNI
jgi:hypothetical protein